MDWPVDIENHSINIASKIKSQVLGPADVDRIIVEIVTNISNLL